MNINFYFIKKEVKIKMTGIIGIFFLLYIVKYFMYKTNDGKPFAKIFDFLLSTATVGFYMFFAMIFIAVYGMERINTKIAVFLTGISLLVLIIKFLFIKKKSMKFTIIIDIFYFIILTVFILVG